MPAPIPFAVRPTSARGADAPPPPPPGFFEGIAASARANQDYDRDAQRGRKREGYAALADALEELGVDRASLQREVQWYEADPAWFGGEALDHEKIWAAAQQAGLAGLPATREEYELGLIGRQGGHARDLATAQRAGLAPNLIGGAAAGMAESNLGPLQFAVGAGGGSVFSRMLIEGTIQFADQAAMEPELVKGRAALGEETSAADVALDLGGAFAGGAALTGAGHVFGRYVAPKATDALRSGFERAVAANWDRLPPGLQERWASRATLPPSGQDVLLADMAESIIGRDNLSEAERGAAEWLRRGAQVEAASPFVPNGAAADLHPRLLGEAMRRVLDDSVLAHPLPPPASGRGFSDSTAISSRTVAVDAPGAQQAFMQRVRRAESGGSDSARNPRSSATGRYQFTDGTWLAYYKRRFGSGESDAAILAKRGDGELQDTLMRDLTADNAAFLRNRGEAVSEGNLYLVHFAGQGGARRIFDADPATPIEDVLGAAVVRANPHLKGMTAGDAIAWAHRAMGAAPSRRAGARAEVGEQVREDSVRRQLQDEIDGITARLDALAGERGADDPASIFATTDAGAKIDAAQPVDLPELLDVPELRARDLELPDPPPFDAELRAVIDTPVSAGGRSLSRIDELAQDLGTSTEALRRGLTQLALEGRIAFKGLDAARQRIKPVRGAARWQTDAEVIAARGGVWDGQFTRKPPGPTGPDDLLRFVARNGGLSYDGLGPKARAAGFKGDDLRNTGTLRHFVPGCGPLLRPNGRGVDEMGELLWEAGYFGPPEATARPSEADVIAAIEHSTLTGEKRFAFGDDPSPTAPLLEDPDRRELHDRFRDAMAAAGELRDLLDDDEGLLSDAALRWSERGEEPLLAIENAVAEHYSTTAAKLLSETGDEQYVPDLPDDALAFIFGGDGRADGARGGGRAGEPGDPGRGGAGRETAEQARAEGERLAALAPEERAPFADPDGDAARAQADSLFHDAKASVRPTASLLEGEAIDPEIAARQAQEAQLGAEAPLRAQADQESTLGLGLFGAADGVRLDAEGEARPIRDLLDEIDAEAAEIKAIRDCL